MQLYFKYLYAVHLELFEHWISCLVFQAWLLKFLAWLYVLLILTWLLAPFVGSISLPKQREKGPTSLHQANAQGEWPGKRKMGSADPPVPILIDLLWKAGFSKGVPRGRGYQNCQPFFTTDRRDILPACFSFYLCKSGRATGFQTLI